METAKKPDGSHQQTEVSLPPPAQQVNPRSLPPVEKFFPDGTNGPPQFTSSFSPFGIQPQMSTHHLPYYIDRPSSSFVTGFMSFFVGIISCGLGGFCFLFCFEKPFARVGIYAGSACALFMLTIYHIVRGIRNDPIELLIAAITAFLAIGMGLVALNAVEDAKRLLQTPTLL
jgi:hypothetical protein